MRKTIFLALLLTIPSLVLGEDTDYFDAALATVSIPEGEQLDAMVDSILNSQLNANPSMRPFRRAFETFYREIFTSDEFRHGLAYIQMDLFTLEELIEIQKMMELPIFKKYEKRMSTFMSKNMDLSQEVITANEWRLRELIDIENERIERLQMQDEADNGK